jgi:cysteinyl-tRNA synthetase
VPIRLTDTRTRRLLDLEPLHPGEVGVYVCGPTVQGGPHVGHLRYAVAFDILRRWLLASGYRVHYVSNVTDIDDKIIANSASEGTSWWELGTRNTRRFTETYSAVGVLPPTGEPRATGHVTEMVDLMARLIADGHAYLGEGGDVWFAVRSLPSYGELSGQQIEAMQPAEAGGGKRDPLDFALWKGAKPGEPSWPTPWGAGRPGWHLECSAMATKYLGPTFDIHGGGQDLVFPHHENELAQSTAAGDGFARLWLHNGLLNTGGAKMSKSQGNSLMADAVLERARPQALRYFLGAPQLRSDLDWSEDGLTEADAAFTRIENFLARAADVAGEPLRPGDDDAGRLRELVPASFAAAMDDDLAVPRALSVLHAGVRDGNSALADGNRAEAVARAREVATMAAALGIGPWQWAGSGAEDGRLRGALDGLVPALLTARQNARERRDWPEADRVRDALAAAGVVVEDTPDGPRWRLG